MIGGRFWQRLGLPEWVENRNRELKMAGILSVSAYLIISESESKEFLRDFTQRCEDPNLDCHDRLSSYSDPERKISTKK